MKTKFLESLRKLKNETGAGLLDCRNALKKTKGDIDEARTILRELGIISYTEDDRPDVHREGAIEVYTHGKIACIVEVNCTTDFVSRNKDFKTFLKRLCLHVTAYNPRYIYAHEIPFSEIKLQEELYKKKYWGKDEKATHTRVQTLMNTDYYPEMCLFNQSWIDDNTRTVQDILAELSLKFGEKIIIKRFSRWEIH